MKIPLVNLKRQYESIQVEIDAVLKEVCASTKFLNGPKTAEFEHQFAQISGAQFGVGVSSGTSALFLALKAAGIGPGDEVITQPNSFIATVESIVQTGATVRFVDIDPVTYLMDPDLLATSITPKTKAVVPVHLYGQLCDMDPIVEIAREHRLMIVNDAAQAHLATYFGKKLGDLGLASAFSFYPGKNLGAYGDAGMVITNDEELAAKVRMLANHGRIDKYEHLVEGYNYRMDEMQAAVLVTKLKYLPEWTKRRQEIAGIYTELLEGHSIITPWADVDSEHVFHLYVIRVQGRDRLMQMMKQKGVGCGIHYPIPLHLQPAFRHLGYNRGDFPMTEEYAEQILSLPVFPEMTNEEVEYVARELILSIPQRTERIIPRVP